MSSGQPSKAAQKQTTEDVRDTLTLIQASLKSMLDEEELDQSLVISLINKSRESKCKLQSLVLDLEM